MSRRTVIAAGGALLAGVGSGLAIPVHAERNFGIVGQIAPEISAEFWIDPDGLPTTFSLSDTRKKWVLLKCFQAWCPGCHRHGFPTAKEVADAFTDDDRVAVVAVQTVFEGFAFNTRAKVREIQLQYDLRIPMGHDPGDPSGDHVPSTMRRYRTGGTPWMVVIEPGGRVVFNDYHIDAERFIDFVRARLA